MLNRSVGAEQELIWLMEFRLLVFKKLKVIHKLNAWPMPPYDPGTTLSLNVFGGVYITGRCRRSSLINISMCINALLVLYAGDL